MPARIQRKPDKGYRMPEGAVYVGRGTMYGNPYRIVRERGLRTSWTVRVDPADGVRGHTYGSYESELAARAAAVDAYRAMGRTPGGSEQFAFYARQLHGRDLACWCPLPEPGEPDHCHGWVLLCIANPDDFCPKGIPADPGHQWTAGAWGPFTCWDCGAAKPVVKKRLLLETDLDDLHLDELFDHAGLHDRITITRLPADDTGPEAAGP